jgi:hypothetical protein
MTILMPVRFDKCFPNHETSSAADVTTTRDLPDFALFWAREEPALVAQHHREWLCWQSLGEPAAPVARRSE